MVILFQDLPIMVFNHKCRPREGGGIYKFLCLSVHCIIFIGGFGVPSREKKETMYVLTLIRNHIENLSS